MKKGASASAPQTNGGGTSPKPFYKKIWFWGIVVAALLLIGISSGMNADTYADGSSSNQEAVLESSVDPSDSSSQASSDAQESSAVSDESAESHEESTTDESQISSTEQESSDDSSGAAPSESSSVTMIEEPQTSDDLQEESKSAQTEEKKYVGSIESDKYHYKSCQWSKKILPENEIWFDSVAEAVAAGYSPCGTCKPPSKDF